MTRSIEQFRLPDVGEGLTEAEIVTWHVGVGDAVTVNQVLVEIETAKSLVELPSPYAGTVSELHANAGQTVDVGAPIISIAVPSAGGGPQGEAPPEDALGAREDRADSGTADPPQRQTQPQLLVGYGERAARPGRRRGAGVGPSAAGSGAAATAVASPPATNPLPSTSQPAAEDPIRAKPPVRKMAKTLGVDLSRLVPTGPGRTVTRSDVSTAHAAASVRNAPSPAADASGPRLSDEQRIPIAGMRKHTAAAVVASAFTAPHVTEFVTVDVNRMMELREHVQRRREFRDIKVSPLLFVARAYLLALRRTPMANARWDELDQEVVLRRQVNLGIAAATPRGLVVPNVKGAQELSLAELALAVNELARTARDGRTTPEGMAHGTTTITNIGVFGIDSGTPILNPGETSILAVGAVRRMPWVVEDRAGERVEPRWVMQLALSFDHRVMDGREGSALLADTAEMLTEPGLALL